ncbi:MAG: cytochrome c3 family protein [Gammaproteobacteria bacterium]|nr:cytochrome c3 family protein [Gammaproteobacteria bacterium]
MSRNVGIAIVSTVGTLVAVGVVVVLMMVGGDRRALLIGATTDAHHQLELSCETCHAAPAFADPETAKSELNKTCQNCHEDALDDADDSHSRKRFRSPRMAAYWEKVDARYCTSCHVEHRPDITRASAVTVAMDFCVACHSEGEQDIRTTRPSHEGLSFDTCAGCHNYHDNRALYEDFLVRHAGQPWLKPEPVHALSAQYRAWKPPEESAVGPGGTMAPAAALADSMIVAHWAGSGHAAAGVTCASCHAPDVADDGPQRDVEAAWIDAPSTSVCRDCHRQEVRTFALGRHGMRQHPELAEPREPGQGLATLGLDATLPETILASLSDPAPPTHMHAAEARLPMRTDAPTEPLNCGTCHDSHAVDIEHAAVAACAACHDDAHTQAYFGSPHHALWLKEQAGEAALGTGVSCATCHMVKGKRRGKVTTNHNQNDSLRPNEKMIRPVCLDCHGLAFSLDALADTDLVSRNFTGRPAVHVESIEWAIQRAEPPDAGR